MGEERLSVWVLIPTAGAPHVPAAVRAWGDQGYKVATYQEPGRKPVESDFIFIGAYRGVWAALNRLSKEAFRRPGGFGADVVLFAGDDMLPDPNHSAAEVAREYLRAFPDGFGVMQPCGDLQGVDESGKPAAARICGSAWFGRGWAERAYLGNGPTNAYYWHFYADEELAAVAQKLGVLWWRPDLVQYHKHWSWGHLPRQEYHEKNQTHWEADQKLFFARQKAGFQGSEPVILIRNRNELKFVGTGVPK